MHNLRGTRRLTDTPYQMVTLVLSSGLGLRSLLQHGFSVPLRRVWKLPANIHIWSTFAQHHVKTLQAQLVRLLTVASRSRAVQFTLHGFCYCQNIEVAMTATGNMADREEKQPQKNKSAARTTAAEPASWRCRHAEFYPYPANNVRRPRSWVPTQEHN